LGISDQQSIDDVRNTTDKVNEGRLDVLFLNADLCLNGPIFDDSKDDIRISIDRNVLSPIIMVKSPQRLIIWIQAAVAIV
jgi:NAD(P)-dependent dehydrogenase (short-subunit alcohol dehydrogenase family)